MTRDEFVPAGEMELGEQVVALEGQLWRLTSITSRAGPESVYNFEVAGEHVYYVGSDGLLVHNVYVKDTIVYLLKKGDDVVYVGITKQLPNIRKAQHLGSKVAGSFDDIVQITGKLTHHQARNLERGLLDAIVKARGKKGVRGVERQLRAAGLLNKNGGRVMERVKKHGGIRWDLIDEDLVGKLLNGII